MNQAWRAVLKTKQEQDDAEALLKNQFIRDTFLLLISRMMAEEERLELNLSSYDNPSWAYKQADLNGARRAYTKMQALFK